MTDLASLLQSANSSAQQPTRFQIPRSDVKPSLQAYLWSLNAGKSEDSHLIIFTHGAGGTCLSPTAAKLCGGLSASCIVIGFDGSSNLKARTNAFMQVIEWSAQAPQVGKITLCGRSMGSRAATLAYAQTTCTKLSGKLVLQSYPLIGNGEEVRKAILLDLPPDTANVMFCQGTEDDMCPSDNLNEARGQMAAKSTSYTVVGLDHGMSCKRKASKIHSKAAVADMLHTEAISAIRDWLDAPPDQASIDRWLNLNEDVPAWTYSAPEMTSTAAKRTEADDKKASATPEVSVPARTAKRKVTQQASVNHTENGPELAEPSLRRSKRSRKLVET